MLDTIINIETPEGTQLPLKPAGLCPRALAFLVDLLIRSAFYVSIGISLGILGTTGLGLTLILLFFIEWFYPVIFELGRHAATPGKRLLRLKVVHDDGTPISLASSMLRNLLRAADFLPFFYMAGILSAALNPHSKRIGDLAAGSMVIYAHPPGKRATLTKESKLSPLPDLSVSEQQEIISFAERCESLTEERANELANILAPLLRHYDDKPSTVLQRMAKGLIGQ